MKTTIKELGKIKHSISYKVEFEMLYDREFIKKAHSMCSCTLRKPVGNIMEITYRPKRPKATSVNVEKEIMVEYKNGEIEIFVIKATVIL